MNYISVGLCWKKIPSHVWKWLSVGIFPVSTRSQRWAVFSVLLCNCWCYVHLHHLCHAFTLFIFLVFMFYRVWRSRIIQYLVKCFAVIGDMRKLAAEHSTLLSRCLLTAVNMFVYVYITAACSYCCWAALCACGYMHIIDVQHQKNTVKSHHISFVLNVIVNTDLTDCK